MKLWRVLLPLLFMSYLILAPGSTPTCATCSELVNSSQSIVFALVNDSNAVQSLRIVADYENDSAPNPRQPIPNTIILVEVAGVNTTPPIYNISKTYTDSNGVAIYNFNKYNSSCLAFKAVYCPFCIPINQSCPGFDQCINFSQMQTTATNISQIPDADDANPPANPNDLNPNHYLPQLATASWCPPPKPLTATPALCLPLIIIFAMLSGALYLTGKNPFAGFNIGSQRIGQHIRYQARAAGYSFSFTQAAQAVSSIAGAVGQGARQGAKAWAKEQVKMAKQSGWDMFGGTMIQTAKMARDSPLGHNLQQKGSQGVMTAQGLQQANPTTINPGSLRPTFGQLAPNAGFLSRVGNALAGVGGMLARISVAILANTLIGRSLDQIWSAFAGRSIFDTCFRSQAALIASESAAYLAKHVPPSGTTSDGKDIQVLGRESEMRNGKPTGNEILTIAAPGTTDGVMKIVLSPEMKDGKPTGNMVVTEYRVNIPGVGPIVLAPSKDNPPAEAFRMNPDGTRGSPIPGGTTTAMLAPINDYPGGLGKDLSLGGNANDFLGSYSKNVQINAQYMNERNNALSQLSADQVKDAYNNMTKPQQEALFAGISEQQKIAMMTVPEKDGQPGRNGLLPPGLGAVQTDVVAAAVSSAADGTFYQRTPDGSLAPNQDFVDRATKDLPPDQKATVSTAIYRVLGDNSYTDIARGQLEAGKPSVSAQEYFNAKLTAALVHGGDNGQPPPMTQGQAEAVVKAQGTTAFAAVTTTQAAFESKLPKNLTTSIDTTAFVTSINTTTKPSDITAANIGDSMKIGAIPTVDGFTRAAADPSSAPAYTGMALRATYPPDSASAGQLKLTDPAFIDMSQNIQLNQQAQSDMDRAIKASGVTSGPQGLVIAYQNPNNPKEISDDDHKGTWVQANQDFSADRGAGYFITRDNVTERMRTDTIMMQTCLNAGAITPHTFSDGNDVGATWRNAVSAQLQAEAARDRIYDAQGEINDTYSRINSNSSAIASNDIQLRTNITRIEDNNKLIAENNTRIEEARAQGKPIDGLMQMDQALRATDSSLRENDTQYRTTDTVLRKQDESDRGKYNLLTGGMDIPSGDSKVHIPGNYEKDEKIWRDSATDAHNYAQTVADYLSNMPERPQPKERPHLPENAGETDLMGPTEGLNRPRGPGNEDLPGGRRRRRGGDSSSAVA